MAERTNTALRAAQLLAACCVCATTLRIVLVYGDYFPPDFRSDFLLGREASFSGPYRWAFYTHLLSGPFCLLSGLALLCERAWTPRPRGHRWVGRAHGAAVLLALAPSGLAMAFDAPGWVAGAGFGVLALLTAACVALGWRSAVRREFSSHRVWMQRTFALLVSAVVLRMMGGLAEVLGVEGTYAWAAWLCWLLPLAGLEVARCFLN